MTTNWIRLAGVAAMAAAVSPVATRLVPAAENGSAASGQEIAFDRMKGNCLACHTMKGSDVPSNVGPELVNIKARYPDRNRLYAILYDEESRNPQTVMPPFGKNLILSPGEINAIIDFLYTL
jgi:sulfur-oxidizing protein SoxX